MLTEIDIIRAQFVSDLIVKIEEEFQHVEFSEETKVLKWDLVAERMRIVVKETDKPLGNSSVSIKLKFLKELPEIVFELKNSLLSIFNSKEQKVIREIEEILRS